VPQLQVQAPLHNVFHAEERGGAENCTPSSRGQSRWDQGVRVVEKGCGEQAFFKESDPLKVNGN